MSTLKTLASALVLVSALWLPTTTSAASTSRADLVIQLAPESPDAEALMVSETEETGNLTVLMFEIENTSANEILVSDIVIGTDIYGDAKLNKIVSEAVISADGKYTDGVVSQKSSKGEIVFSSVNEYVSAGDTVTFEIEATFLPSKNAYKEGTQIQFDVAASGITAKNNKTTKVVTGSAESPDYLLVSGPIYVEPKEARAATTVIKPVSTSYGTYTIRYQVTATDHNLYIPRTASTSGTAGALYTVNDKTTFSGVQNAALTSTADVKNGYFFVPEGEVEDFTLTVTLDPSASGNYDVRLSGVGYGLNPAVSKSRFDTPSSNTKYKTPSIAIPDAATTTSSLQIAEPVGSVYTIGAGDSFAIKWTAANVPPGATVCTKLVRVDLSKNNETLFPGSNNCAPAANGTYFYAGKFTSTSGYPLVPGTYRPKVVLYGPAKGRKDGPVLLESVSKKTVSLIAPAAAAPTCKVTASKTSVLKDETFTVSWLSTNADYGMNKLGEKVATKGSQSVSVGTAGPYEYPMTFYGKGGKVSCTAGVTVTTPLASTVSAAIDAEPLKLTDWSRTLTGTASGLTKLTIIVIPTWRTTSVAYRNDSVPVTNGKWSRPVILPPATYTVEVHQSTQTPSSSTLLTTGTFTVSGPRPAPEAQGTGATSQLSASALSGLTALLESLKSTIGR